MSLHDDEAVVFHNVCKTYRLYQNRVQMVKDVLGIGKKKQDIPEFHALKNVTLSIKKGERVGLVGRNGAGKSTLLKLITGNFAATSGDIAIHGSVQALMNTGIGFHPDFSGLENIKSALLYNGLDEKQFKEAVEDVIDFVELGAFIDQPFKTYSLGMQSRLYFAVATAIQPEILIVDEVLGAGDAYFSAKSADRMKRLTGSGCTLILVSHSTQQVLQFCERAIWIECGEVMMDGPAIDIIKAYEAYSKKLELESASEHIETKSIIQSKWLREKLLKDVLAQHHASTQSHMLPSGEGNGMKESISRWRAHEEGLKISQIKLLNNHEQLTCAVTTGDELNIEIVITAELAGCYDVYFMILLFTNDGRWLSRLCSEKYEISLNQAEEYSIRLKFDEILLGSGKYIFSAGIYKILDLHHLETARYYDLLSRSFEFKVNGHYSVDETIFFHPAKWQVTAPKEKPRTISAISV